MSFSDPSIRALMTIIGFPMLFQTALIAFAWGTGDAAWLMAAKRLFLLLPVCAVIVACWASVVSVLSIPIRAARQEFITSLFVTWWDLGKSVLSFWGGIFAFAFKLPLAALSLVRVAAFAVWALLTDLVLMPFNLLRHMGSKVVRSPIPWIAVSLTLAWCLIETTIFTYVMTPVVVDTFSNLTGETMRDNFVRVPLFLFLFFVVMGSYAVLSTMIQAVKSKNVQQITGILMVEAVTIFVEVMFLYREFVDSLVPWFAQYSPNFQLGVAGTIAIASFVWFGIRSLSWFLFAAHGTPTIMAVIQGRALEFNDTMPAPRARMLEMTEAFWTRTAEESAWMRERGNSLLAAFMLPPLQIVAAAINFCTLCLLNKHLFALPFTSLDSIRYSEEQIRDLKARSGFQGAPGSRAAARSSRRSDELEPESIMSGRSS
jgi:hypothetical protein